jgi:hypothetical protein
MTMTRLTVIAASAALLVPAAPAVAQDPITDGYGGRAGQVQIAEPSTGQGRSTPTPTGDVAGESSGSRTPAPQQGGGSSPAADAAPSAAAPREEAKDSGDLPFTGLDTFLVVAGGLVLLSVGVALRRLSRPAT